MDVIHYAKPLVHSQEQAVKTWKMGKTESNRCSKQSWGLRAGAKGMAGLLSWSGSLLFSSSMTSGHVHVQTQG